MSAATDQNANGVGRLTRVEDYSATTTLTGTIAYTYDARGRLSQATAAGVTYRVNALGQRVRKSGGGSDVVYHYDKDGRLIAEADAQGQITREYVYLNDVPLAVLE